MPDPNILSRYFGLVTCNLFFSALVSIRVPAILPDPFQKPFAISVALPTKFGDIADQIYQVLATLAWLEEMAETINNFLF